MTSVYMDMCSLQRPLNDKIQLRVQLEAEAVQGIIELIEHGRIEMISSDALIYEAMRIPHPIRKDTVLKILELAPRCIQNNPEVEERAAALMTLGFKLLDALHVASAIATNADYFCTCDDRLLNKAKSILTPLPRIVDPLELVEAIEQ